MERQLYPVALLRRLPILRIISEILRRIVYLTTLRTILRPNEPRFSSRARINKVILIENDLTQELPTEDPQTFLLSESPLL